MDEIERVGLLSTTQDGSLSKDRSITSNHQAPDVNHDSDGILSPNVLPRHQMLDQFQLLIILFLIISLSVGFSLAVEFSAGGIRAPPSVARFAISNPRIVPQTVAIVATALTATINWVRGCAATLLAQKRLRQPRPIIEIEVLSAVKYASVAWTWEQAPWAMLATTSIVVIGGFLTSGFVALLTPLPIAQKSEFSIGDVDFNSHLPYCTEWMSRTANKAFCARGQGKCYTCEIAKHYPNSNGTFSTCINDLEDILVAAKSSMLYRFASEIPIVWQSNYIASFAQWSHLRTIGTTYGTLPIGPGGIHPFSDSTFPRISDTTFSYNYTLQLQGIWTTAACAYTDRSQSKIHMNPDNNGRLSYNITCPGSGFHPFTQLRNETKTHGLILAGVCVSRSDDNIVIHLRSFVDASDYNSQIRQPAKMERTPRSEVAPWLSGDKAKHNHASPLIKPRDQKTMVYSGIDAMECILTPRAGAVTATYLADLAAFNMTPSQSEYIPLSRMGRVGFSITQEAAYQTMNKIILGQTIMSGNALGQLIRSVAMSYGHIDTNSKNDEYPRLVADTLKGIFEYQVTWLRVVFTAVDPDPVCNVPIKGTLVEETIGWLPNAQFPTMIALLPMLITCLGTVAVVFYVMRMRTILTKFDPTTAVALIAASSVGEVEVLDRNGERDCSLVGDPEDRVVRGTEVEYGYRKGRWGLWS